MEIEGDFACEVAALKVVDSHETNEPSYVIELVVLESDTPLIRPGQDRSITINRLFSKKEYNRKKALGNLKGFLAAVFAEALGMEIDPELPHPGDNDMNGWEKLADQSLLDDGAALRGTKFRVKIAKLLTGEQKQHVFWKPTFRKF
jgi:hypothetical protein